MPLTFCGADVLVRGKPDEDVRRGSGEPPYHSVRIGKTSLRSRRMDSGGFVRELEVTLFLVLVIAAVFDGGFHFDLLLAGRDFFG